MALSPLITTIIASIGMFLMQTNGAFVTLGYKYVAARGAFMSVLVAYRLAVAAVILTVATVVNERYIKKLKEEEKMRLQLSWTVWVLAFFCGLCGGSLGSNLFVASLNSTSTTSATAISNLTPAVTFIISLILRRETLALHTWSGRAKIVGTVVVIAGAMTLSFYKGHVLEIVPAGHSAPILIEPSSHKHGELVGTLLALATSISSSTNVILQDLLLERYPNNMRVTALVTWMGACQSIIYAGLTQRDPSHWYLEFTMLGTVLLYAGIVASGLMMVITSWCITKKGSFFVSVFSPVLLIMVALFSPLILGEPLHVGSVVGAFFIFSGLYLIIWGKRDEKKKAIEDTRETEAEPPAQEIQAPAAAQVAPQVLAQSEITENV